MPFSTPSICGSTGPWHQGPQAYTSMPAKRVFTGGSMATRNSARSCARHQAAVGLVVGDDGARDIAAIKGIARGLEPGRATLARPPAFS